ncbi:MAG: hypothetical protein KJP18_12470 [Gemmatimonadetes bacterium]|nr:hypothetical protein [Gemmatimonadota bacterium]NNK61951.1 hypothetical protein [Gemmatimonadota bacterium]
MIRSPSITKRAIWALLALVQLGVTGVGPLADAFHEDPSERVAHVESESTSDCGTHHDHLFCQVCRTVLASPDGIAPPCLSLPFPSAAGIVLASVEGVATGSPLVSALGSRAPPRA